MSDAVRVDRDGPVTVVTLDRPAVRNAVDAATADALREAFEAFDAGPRWRCSPAPAARSAPVPT